MEGGLSLEVEEEMMTMQDTIGRLHESVRNKEEHIAQLCIVSYILFLFGWLDSDSKAKTLHFMVYFRYSKRRKIV